MTAKVDLVRIAELHVTNQERQALAQRVLDHGRHVTSIEDVEQATNSGAKAIAEMLSGNAERFRLLERFGRQDGQPYLVLRNLFDASDAPPTPQTEMAPSVGTTSWFHNLMLTMGSIAASGHVPGAFADEMDGNVCHMIAPVDWSDEAKFRTTKYLSPHTELVTGRLRSERSNRDRMLIPDILTLSCYRNPSHTATQLFVVDEVLQLLSTDVKAALRSACFVGRSQSSFAEADDIMDLQVLFDGPFGHPVMRYSSTKILGATDEAARAQKSLVDAVEQRLQPHVVCLDPGDVLMIDNQRSIHGRDGLVEIANFDGTDRWMTRVYGFDQAAFNDSVRLPGRPHVLVDPASPPTH